MKAGVLHHADGWSRDTEEGEHHFDDRMVSDVFRVYSRRDLFGKGLSLMIKMLASELERIRARHKVYMRERMQVLISDAQYLWWDWVFVNRFEEALKEI